MKCRLGRALEPKRARIGGRTLGVGRGRPRGDRARVLEPAMARRPNSWETAHMPCRLQPLAAGLVALTALIPVSAAQVTTRVSIDTRGIEGNAPSGAFANSGLWGSAITPDGRWIAFESQATNLAAADSNSLRDVFVHDRQTGVSERVSLDSLGTEGDGPSSVPAL